jgi:hypothetical protein
LTANKYAVQPGVDVNTLGRDARIAAVFAALEDAQLMASMSEVQRRHVQNAADRMPGTDDDSLRMAVVSIINRVTTRAAFAGDYDEWPAIKSRVHAAERQPRPFYGTLRLASLTGAKIVAWTAAEARPGELRLMRAIITTGPGKSKVRVKIEEFWGDQHQRLGYPMLRLYKV